MLDYLIYLLVGLAGYAGASWWLVPVAAGALTVESWLGKVRRLRRQPDAPLSSKIVTYLVTGVVAKLGYAALTFLCGRLVRGLLQ